MAELPPEVLEPLREWRDRAASAAIPRSARGYVSELYQELVDAVAAGEPPTDVLRQQLHGAEGIDPRGRALRILDRTGHVAPAVRAVEEARRRLAEH